MLPFWGYTCVALNSYTNRPVTKEKMIMRLLTVGWGGRAGEVRMLMEVTTFNEVSITKLPFPFTEANPEKFNSRFRNKMFYAGVSIYFIIITYYLILTNY